MDLRAYWTIVDKEKYQNYTESDLNASKAPSKDYQWRNYKIRQISELHWISLTCNIQSDGCDRRPWNIVVGGLHACVLHLYSLCFYLYSYISACLCVTFYILYVSIYILIFMNFMFCIHPSQAFMLVCYILYSLCFNLYSYISEFHVLYTSLSCFMFSFF